MASAVYEGPGGLVCTAVVFPSVVALFRLLRAPLRPLMSDHLQRAGIHASQDQLDKGVALAVSAVHALVNAVFSTYKLCRGEAFSTLRPDTFLCRYHIALTIGYMCEDLWDMQQTGLLDLPFAFHHLCIIAVVGSAVFLPAMRHYGPLWGVVEYSTVLLNVIGLMKWGGGKNSPTLRRLEIAFAVSFFLLRIVWVPYTWYGMNAYHAADMQQLPRLLWCAYSAFVVLQFYWAFLIVRKYMKRRGRTAQ